MSQTVEDKFLTPDEVGARLRVTPQTVRTLFREGKLGGFRVGRQIRIFKDSVDALIRAGRRRVKA